MSRQRRTRKNDTMLEPVAPQPEPDQQSAPMALSVTASNPTPMPSFPPAMDPMHGDKTPAYVEWYRHTHSDAEFQAKYGHRKIS